MTNKTRDKIHIALEFTKRSGIPVLLLSNPGMAKTTIVNSWAEKNGYRTEELIGSRFSREEIAGYMVKEDTGGSNGQTGKLIHYNPDWYDRVLESKKPTLLFLDELSTCSEDVQGSLLQLIFAKTIACGKKLPDNCLVVGAANYKENLPVQFDIMPPTLNRFCIVNLKAEKSIDFIDEFLQDPEEREQNIIQFKNEKLTADIKVQIQKNIRQMFISIFSMHAEKGNGPIDVNNQCLNEMYRNQPIENGPVVNFISGRTMYYTKRLAETLFTMGLPKKYNTEIQNMLAGLIGGATFSFENEDQYKRYMTTIGKSFCNTYRIQTKKTETPVFNVDIDNTSIHETINKYMFWAESNDHNVFDDTLTKIYTKIYNKYDVKPENVKKVLESGDFVLLYNDIESINTFSQYLKEVLVNAVPEIIIENLSKILLGWSSYQEMLLK